MARQKIILKYRTQIISKPIVSETHKIRFHRLCDDQCSLTKNDTLLEYSYIRYERVMIPALDPSVCGKWVSQFIMEDIRDWKFCPNFIREHALFHMRPIGLRRSACGTSEGLLVR